MFYVSEYCPRNICLITYYFNISLLKNIHFSEESFLTSYMCQIFVVFFIGTYCRPFCLSLSLWLLKGNDFQWNWSVKYVFIVNSNFLNYINIIPRLKKTFESYSNWALNCCINKERMLMKRRHLVGLVFEVKKKNIKKKCYQSFKWQISVKKCFFVIVISRISFA